MSDSVQSIGTETAVGIKEEPISPLASKIAYILPTSDHTLSASSPTQPNQAVSGAHPSRPDSADLASGSQIAIHPGLPAKGSTTPAVITRPNSPSTAGSTVSLSLSSFSPVATPKQVVKDRQDHPNNTFEHRNTGTISIPTRNSLWSKAEDNLL